MFRLMFTKRRFYRNMLDERNNEDRYNICVHIIMSESDGECKNQSHHIPLVQ